MKLPCITAPVLVAALVATPAAASLDETLDVSLHGTHSFVRDRDPSSGLSARAGVTSHEVRFGVGVGASYGVRSAEAFLGYANNGFWKVRPFVEMRGHVERVDDETKNGIGVRGGVLVPLSEYFFLDLGVGRDVVGEERFRASIGLGLPIPLSHL